jgi:hypothetical protein
MKLERMTNREAEGYVDAENLANGSLPLIGRMAVMGATRAYPATVVVDGGGISIDLESGSCFSLEWGAMAGALMARLYETITYGPNVSDLIDVYGMRHVGGPKVW